MPTSLLPSIDASGQLREAAFTLLLHKRHPIEVVELAQAARRGAADWAACASAAERLP